jgi:hypothetical protein
MKKFLCFLLLGITRCAYPAEITAPSGATSSQITPITNSITAIQTDISTLGDVPNSYVVVNTNRASYTGVYNERATYGFVDYEGSIFFDGCWTVAEDAYSRVCTNSSLSKIVPTTEWYDASTGLATNLNIKFFSGTDALQQAEIETKASTNETAQLQSQINSLGIFAVENYLSTNIVNFGYAPTNASRVMCTAQSAGATNFIVTYAATGTYGYVALCTNTTFYTNVAGTATLIDWSSENASGSLTEKFELYAFEKGTTNAVEIGDVAIPQLVPSGATPTMRTFSIPYTAYGNTNGYYFGVRAKLTANTGGALNKTQWVGDGYNTHIQYSQPSTILTEQFANKDGSNITDPAAFGMAIGAVSTNDSHKVGVAMPIIAGNGAVAGQLLTLMGQGSNFGIAGTKFTLHGAQATFPLPRGSTNMTVFYSFNPTSVTNEGFNVTCNVLANNYGIARATTSLGTTQLLATASANGYIGVGTNSMATFMMAIPSTVRTNLLSVVSFLTTTNVGVVAGGATNGWFIEYLEFDVVEDWK